MGKAEKGNGQGKSKRRWSKGKGGGPKEKGRTKESLRRQEQSHKQVDMMKTGTKTMSTIKDITKDMM
eukprot:11897108-Prorocentrum_lima.AAC.1